MAANRQESGSRECCQHIAALFPKLGLDVPKWVADGARNYYGLGDGCRFDKARFDHATRLLCETIHAMTEMQKTDFLFDGRSAECRRLADWWDEHCKADAARGV